MTDLKVGYVLKRYPRFSETFVVGEILAHEAAGQEIEIFALRPVAETHFQDNLGQVRAPVTFVPHAFRGADALWQLIAEAHARLPDAARAFARMADTDGRDVAQAIVVALACRDRGVGHLHAHFGTVSTAVARLAAALAGIGYSFTAHAKDIYYDYEAPQHLDRKIADAKAVVTVSDYNVGFLQDRFGAAPGNVLRIYNGLDLTRFPYVPPEPGAREVLAVGRLVEKKGFHILVEAIRLMRASGRDVTCRIVGSGDERENLAAQIDVAGLGDAVTLAGPMAQAEVVAEMRRAAVFACPCVVGGDGNRDGLPTVLLEAMALGLPCVATPVTGIPELISDGETGLLVPEADPEGLASGLARALDDPGLREEMSRRGRARIERDFDVVRNAATLRAVFSEAMGTAGADLRGVA
ncbi:glycosyltransferase family 4 protein [Histidinibacterium lentulum]|uniref:Colanic acid biosynthesis glycosyltransferase WcaL n=1 Tax=Histidinibacterium lentulum TaxID=2480588 RepID=A0A3N2QY88_9RHOB|nr:glycosyltransferase family 4 protein [Histidinibacterium lentulum]ROU00157.1 colanic acid biosynthesis glycosyltransferase WcaL [Histidinibacterium lentulum]